MKVPTIEVRRGARHTLGWYVRLVAANGQVLMHSEVYASKSNAVRAGKRASTITGVMLAIYSPKRVKR